MRVGRRVQPKETLGRSIKKSINIQENARRHRQDLESAQLWPLGDQGFSLAGQKQEQEENWEASSIAQQDAEVASALYLLFSL